MCGPLGLGLAPGCAIGSAVLDGIRLIAGLVLIFVGVGLFARGNRLAGGIAMVIGLVVI